MGYNTRYNLSVIGAAPDDAEHLARDVVSKDYGLTVESLASGDTDEMKWYKHKEDMLALSRRWPGLVFQLIGEGEEAGDLWHKYFKDGKMQECRSQITYAPFDPEKLK